MKPKAFQVGIWALLLLALSSFASAQVCQGTLSAPTREVYVGNDFNVTFFNAENTTVGDTLTLNLPPELARIAGANPVSPITQFGTYRWTIRGSSAGTFGLNVTLEGSVNCTKAFSAIVVTSVPAPIIIPSITDLGATASLTLNQPVTVTVNLTNVGGTANSVSGIVSSNSGSLVSLNWFSHPSIANSTTVSTTHTFTPQYCGVDAITAYVSNIHDANGIDVAPVQVTDMFVVKGSDVAFTTIGATSPVVRGNDATFSFTVKNIGDMDTNNVQVQILVDGSSVPTVNIGTLNRGVSSPPQTYTYSTSSISAGIHTVTFRVSSAYECSSPDNEVSTTFVVTGPGSFCGNGIVEIGEQCDGSNLNGQTCVSQGYAGGGTLACNAGTCTFNTAGCSGTPSPFCGDGSCNGAETCSSCSADCGACASGGGGGGGGGGGSAGKIYYLILTPEHPTQSLYLKSGDTVKYTWKSEEFSFPIRYIYSDKAKMGVSRATGYKEYSLDENVKYNLNLDDEPLSDLGVRPTDLYLGAGNFTFDLLQIPEKKPIFTLPFLKKVKTVEANQTAEVAGEPEIVEPVEETFSEGVLEFIESVNVKSSAPLWAGVGVALLVILLGLGAYFIATRKKE